MNSKKAAGKKTLLISNYKSVLLRAYRRINEYSTASVTQDTVTIYFTVSFCVSVKIVSNIFLVFVYDMSTSSTIIRMHK